MSTVSLEGIEDSFDNDEGELLLSLSLGRITHTSELLRKSMYDFDLETPEGIEKLMALLPIMDPEILKDIMTEIWPGYPTELDPRRHRMEIKGYLKDYLESYDTETEGEQLEEPSVAGEVQETTAGEAGAEGAEPPPADSVPDASAAPPQSGASEQTKVASDPTA